MRELKEEIMRELKREFKRELKQEIRSEGAHARELKQGSSSERALARELEKRRQTGKQAVGRHSVGAMPWRGLLKDLLGFWLLALCVCMNSVQVFKFISSSKEVKKKMILNVHIKSIFRAFN